MFGKLKDWLGIEGAKVKIQALEVYPKDVATVNGELEFSSIRKQTIHFIRLKLIEKYTRGRGDNKKIDEYELGKWTHSEPFDLVKDQPVVLFFQLPFEFLQSNMDKREDRSIFAGNFVASIAKTMYGVSSEYRLEVEAVVEGSNHPISDKKVIQFQ